jgi:hypothetical protein
MIQDLANQLKPAVSTNQLTSSEFKNKTLIWRKANLTGATEWSGMVIKIQSLKASYQCFGMKL